jgi:predicted DNA binding CopG/RHH family protein
MRKRTKYTDEEIGPVRVVRDFLPPPNELVLRDDKVKITIALSKSSVRFFKRMARQNRTPYQKMIRSLLDHYVSLHARDLS